MCCFVQLIKINKRPCSLQFALCKTKGICLLYSLVNYSSFQWPWTNWRNEFSQYQLSVASALAGPAVYFRNLKQQSVALVQTTVSPTRLHRFACVIYRKEMVFRGLNWGKFKTKKSTSKRYFRIGNNLSCNIISASFIMSCFCCENSNSDQRELTVTSGAICSTIKYGSLNKTVGVMFIKLWYIIIIIMSNYIVGKILEIFRKILNFLGKFTVSHYCYTPTSNMRTCQKNWRLNQLASLLYYFDIFLFCFHV